MNTLQVEMLHDKEDGHRYSRPTRRIVRLLDLSRAGDITVVELAKRAVSTPEFHWTRRGGGWGPISTVRARDYINFAKAAGFLLQLTPEDTLRACDDIPKSGTLADADWTAKTSLRALEFLGQLLEVHASIVAARDRIKQIVHRLQKDGQESTIGAIAQAAGITGSRDEEVFRWALLIHIDGGNSQFSLRRQPRVVWRG